LRHTTQPTASSENTFIFFSRALFPKSLFQFLLFHQKICPAIGKYKHTDHFVHFTYMLHISFSKYYFAFAVQSIKIEYIICLFTLRLVFHSHSSIIFTRTCHINQHRLQLKKSVLKAFSLKSVVSCE